MELDKICETCAKKEHRHIKKGSYNCALVSYKDGAYTCDNFSGALSDEAKVAYYVLTHPDQLPDSGTRREFGTGAVRDGATDKGRCDLLPAECLLRVAKHYERGAKKYADNNWKQGIPSKVFLDSAIRHLLKYAAGRDEEDHLAAVAFNIFGLMYNEQNKPELMDLAERDRKRSFNYFEEDL